jgi:hypothetical protein
MIVADRLFSLADKKDNIALGKYLSWCPEEFNVRIGMGDE